MAVDPPCWVFFWFFLLTRAWRSKCEVQNRCTVVLQIVPFHPTTNLYPWWARPCFVAVRLTSSDFFFAHPILSREKKRQRGVSQRFWWLGTLLQGKPVWSNGAFLFFPYCSKIVLIIIIFAGTSAILSAINTRLPLVLISLSKKSNLRLWEQKEQQTYIGFRVVR